MKLALFTNADSDYRTVCEEWAERHADYVRVSEFVDVTFPPLREEAVIERQLEALDRTETELRSKFQDKLNSIESRRAELRAITYKAD